MGGINVKLTSAENADWKRDGGKTFPRPLGKWWRRLWRLRGIQRGLTWWMLQRRLFFRLLEKVRPYSLLFPHSCCWWFLTGSNLLDDVWTRYEGNFSIFSIPWLMFEVFPPGTILLHDDWGTFLWKFEPLSIWPPNNGGVVGMLGLIISWFTLLLEKMMRGVYFWWTLCAFTLWWTWIWDCHFLSELWDGCWICD